MGKYVIMLYMLLVPGVTLYIRRKIKGLGKSGVTVIVKGLCTAAILALSLTGLVNTPEHYRVYAALIVAGLAFGLAGDIAICNDFLAGMAFFALGHLCYIIAFISISENLVWALPVFIMLYLIAVAAYRKCGMAPGKMLVPMIVYCAILAAMLSFASAVPIGSPEMPASRAVLAGAVFFTAADAILALCSFKTRKVRLKKPLRIKLGIVSTSSYFLGQSLIAVSIIML